MRKDGILQVVKATLAALIFSLVFVIIFTLIIQLASVKASVIKPVNQVFKIIAVAVGGLLFIRGEKGFLKGAIAGLASVLLSYVLFGIMVVRRQLDICVGNSPRERRGNNYGHNSRKHKKIVKILDFLACIFYNNRISECLRRFYYD